MTGICRYGMRRGRSREHKSPAAGILTLFLVSLLLVPASLRADLRELASEYQAARAKLKGLSRRELAESVATTLRPRLLAIGELDDANSLRFLEKEFNTPQPEISAACVAAILANTSDRALEILVAGFSRRPVEVRKEILEELSSTDRSLEPAGRTLLGLLRTERQSEVLVLLPRVVGKLDSLTAARALLASLRPEGRDRKVGGGSGYNLAVVEALKRTGNPEIRSWLAGDAFTRASPDQLKVLILLVGEMKLQEARSRLADLVGHSSEDVAAAAIVALDKIGLGEDGARTLMDLLRKSQRRGVGMKIRLLDALAASGDPSALEVVLDAARDGDLETRTIAMMSLARQPASQKALQGILGGLDDAAYEVRNAAIRALGHFRAKTMVAPLIEHIGREKEEKLRVDALRLLVRLTGKNMGLDVTDWKKWWEVAAASFEFPEGEKTITTVTAYDLEYFGIEVTSKRVAFLVDVSSSMLREVDVKKQLRTDAEDEEGERGGRTRVARRGRGGKGGVTLKPGRAKKIDVLKYELVRVLRELSVDTFINIVSFHVTFQAWKKQLHALAGPGRKQAIDFVLGLNNGRGTNVFDTLEMALRDRRVDTIFLLTDGKPTRGKHTDPGTILGEIRKLNRIRGATIHCIAFGEESGLLKDLARENNGAYRFVDTYEERR